MFNFIKKSLLIIYAILGMSCYFIPLNCAALYGAIIELMFVILLLKIFIIIDYRFPVEKSFAFFLTLLAFFHGCVFTWHETPFALSISLFIFEIILYILMFFWSIYRSYEISSDKYKKEGVYLIFKTPKGFIDYLLCIIFKPTSSVSAVVDGIRYGYTLGQRYRAEKYEYCNGDKYIKLKIPSAKAKKNLSKIISAKWGFTHNCCHAVWGLFDYKFSIWDSFPCKFSKTIKRILLDAKK